MFTLLVKDLYSSYKDLPLTLFQIQTKYRDEARPRAGLIRGREFIMKDAYSFDIDDDGLDASYQAQREAYQRIFERLGLEYVIVAATSGAMGGSRSEEFLTPTPIGEDTFVRSAGGYAANVEAVTTVVPDAVPFEDAPAAHVEDTPDTPTIDTLVAVANERFARPDRAWTAADTLKNVVLALVHPTGERELLVVGLPGDRDVDLKRLEAARVTGRGRGRGRGRLRGAPRAGEGLHRPGRARSERAGRRGCGPDRRPVPARPARRARHALDHRRERARPARLRPGRRPRLHRGRHGRGGRGPRRRPGAGRFRSARAGPRDRDRPHLPARAASTPRRSA